MTTETVEAKYLQPGDRVLDAEGVAGEVIAAWVIGGRRGVEVTYAPTEGGVATMDDTALYPCGVTVERVVV